MKVEINVIDVEYLKNQKKLLEIKLKMKMEK